MPSPFDLLMGSGVPSDPISQDYASLIPSAPPTGSGLLSRVLAPDLSQDFAPAAPSLAPPAAAPAQPEQNGGILSRIAGLITGGASKIGNTLMPAPDGLSQYITPDAVRQARGQAVLAAGLNLLKNSGPADPQHPAATTLSALGSAGQAAQGAYSDALMEPLQQGMTAFQIAELGRKFQARQAIQQQFAPQPGETPIQQAQRQANMSAAFAGAGMADEAKGVASGGDILARGLNSPQQKLEDFIPVTTQDGQVHMVNKNTGQDMGPIKSGPAAPDASAARTAGSQLEALQHDYQSVSKPYQASVSAYNELQGLMNSGASPSSVIAAYARLINPGRAASAGVMGVLGDMGAVGQQLQNWYSKKTTGAFDPQIAALIRQGADGTMAQLRAQNQNDVETTVQRGIALGLPEGRVRTSLSIPKVTLYGERTAGAIAPGRQTPFGLTQ
jgi:hypothetical protein